MKAHKVRITAQKVDELMALFRAMPTEPIGAHLSDEEFIGYAMQTLRQEDVSRIDEHLATCPDCTVEVERLLEGAEAWSGEQGEQRLARLRDRMYETLPESPTLLGLQVIAAIAFTAKRLAHTQRQGPRFKTTGKLFQYWLHADLTCVLSEDVHSLVFSVDTTDASYDKALTRFALVDADTAEEHVAGLLVLHPDPINEGRYIASARLDDDVRLPEHCQPQLAFVALDGTQPLDREVLLTAVSAATKAADRQAWCTWAQQEVKAGRLPHDVAEAIRQCAAGTQ